MKREPLVTRASITAAVAAIIGLLVAFGVPITTEQKAAVIGLVAILAPLVVAAVTRHKVSPVGAPPDADALVTAVNALRTDMLGVKNQITRGLPPNAGQ